MHNQTIARNYAEALLALAQKADDLDGWGALIGGLADAVQRDQRLTTFLAAPQVAAADKKAVIEKAFADIAPRTLVRFLHKLIDNRRQTLIPDIATEYATLVDEVAGRVHAQVTLARDASEADRVRIAEQLTETLGKLVVPHIIVNPAILGGIVVKVGDKVMDGSVRKRLTTLRSRLTAVR
jgi:F-type H+-transporting ATPase subunit delta